MIKSGLCSITFRQMEPDAVIQAVAKAGLDGIEWGGDIHVVPGDAAHARAVGEATRSAGLEVSSYGSYYRLGKADPPHPFSAVLESAEALGAPVIRVWAGECGSEAATEAHRQAVVEDGRRVAREAGAAGLEVALEYHGNSLTDTRDSALWLLEAVNEPNFKTYWQPPIGQEDGLCLGDLDELKPYLSHLHVFQWVLQEGQLIRRPLEEGLERWGAFFGKAVAQGGDRYALMEFVRDDDPAQFYEDSATLKGLLSSLQD